MHLHAGDCLSRVMKATLMFAAAETSACSSSMMHAHKQNCAVQWGSKEVQLQEVQVPQAVLRLLCCWSLLPELQLQLLFEHRGEQVCLQNVLHVYLSHPTPLQNCMLCKMENMFSVLATFAMHPSVWQSQWCDAPGKAKSVNNLDADMSAVYVTGT